MPCQVSVLHQPVISPPSTINLAFFSNFILPLIAMAVLHFMVSVTPFFTTMSLYN